MNLDLNLPKHGAIIDLASVPLDLVKARRGYDEDEYSICYDDSRVHGLTFHSPCRGQAAEWWLLFSCGLATIHCTIGVYPAMSLEEARDKARAKRASLGAEMRRPPTVVECAAYDLALAAYKSGKGARADVVQSFLRIAQMPQEVQGEMDVPPEKLPPSEALQIRVADLELDGAPLSMRAQNVLQWQGVSTVAHLLWASDNELLRLPGFGRKSLIEVRTAMRAALAKWPEAKSPQPSLSAAIALQRKILAQLEEQTALARSSLSMLESIAGGAVRIDAEEARHG